MKLFVFLPPNSYVEALTQNVTVFGDCIWVYKEVIMAK